MKRIILLMMAGVFFFAENKAQVVELGVFTGYTWPSNVRTYYGDYNIADNANFGGHLSYGMAPNTFLELSYNRFESTVSYFYGSISEPVGLVTDYIQIGGLQQTAVGSGNILPYGAVSLGASVFTVQDATTEFNAGSKWMMAATIAGGVKLHIGDALGIRLQARLGLPMYFNGLYLGTGGAGASLRVPMVQFDLSAGVFLRLGGGA